MDDTLVRRFMELAGQNVAPAQRIGTEQERVLGARLLLSEVLEYIIHGLGVTPEINGVRIEDPNAVDYAPSAEPQTLEMLDGLADVAYTMFWNSCAFGLPLEQAFDLVCRNNLEKFVRLDSPRIEAGSLPPSQWHCQREVEWPEEVSSVEIVEHGGDHYAVGKDKGGKVRKHSRYSAVDLSILLST